MALNYVYDQQFNFTLDTLAAGTVVGLSTKIDGGRGSGFKVVKSQIWLDFGQKTTDEGPIMFGVAASLNAAEIQEALVSDPQSRVPVDNEHSKRPIWPLLMIGKDVTSNDQAVIEMTLVEPGWSIIEGQSYTYWAFNMDTALLTTGTRLSIFAKHTGVWLKD